MLKIFGGHYYLDLDKIEEFTNVKNESSVEGEIHISVVKYEMVKTMIEVLLSEGEEVDESLGEKSSNIGIPFKLAFNTLLNKKILNKY